jgi:hypothetical protein
MWLAFLVLAIAIGVGVYFGVKQGKVTKQLYADGKIIPRPGRFAEKGEEFTSRIGTMQALSDALKSMYLPCKMEGNTGEVRFTSEKFTAHLVRDKFDEPSGIAVYRFEFTSWKTNNGMYVEANAMNALMTSVEKVFLSLDPNTGVKTYEIDFKTKHNIF